MKLLLIALLLLGFQMSHSADNPLLKDAVKAPPVVYWASLGRTESVKQLLADGASPNSVDEEGWSALQAAAENGYLEIVEILVRAGANIHYSFSGKTALQFAVSAKQEKVVRYLKSVGAK
ncbi:ankyrin repeat domain-containing protein [Jeongeupia naejangsanensis]|uniref:Ankyrin repeat domain-containing protein n=1 Tax=Jeongeupia naejangsanensis TaxID=613195 RepID=A0ABS2BKD5_9NEIS|nr:ankyrin repeat domain-containing protein [Jeongeupia naejangsanensis]MBM3116070.1 ankyrin repeat domain-containing protein [Jeongeupia naejangsanensis]